jgi:hypothetical protein
MGKAGLIKQYFRRFLLCRKMDLMRQLSILVVTVFTVSVSYSNPVLNNVTSGNVSVTQSGATTTVNQGSQQAIINWNSFNIGTGEKTQFVQPNASSVALNRINPTQGASQIYGSLSANGRIILINAAGIHFGPGSMVNVGGLIASTSDISNANFLSGNYKFDIRSPYNGSIINEGTLIAASHGLIALLGSNITNTGLIQAEMGSVVLGAGNTFTLDFYGDQLINFSVDESATNGGTVKNTGTLLADGGKILVTAQTAQNVLDNAIDMEGVAQTHSVDTQNGEIILSSDANVNVSGTLDASGLAAGELGGTIQVLGNTVHLASTANLNANGEAGGGVIAVGGSEHGAGPLQNALTTTVDAGALLQANAMTTGNGGSVVVWSNDNTQFAGMISATGGLLGGNGGHVEVSGQVLGFTGGVDLRAYQGLTGDLLLDPAILEVVNGGSGTISGGQNDNTSTSIDPTIVDAALNSANLILNADTNITITNGITWTSGNTLTLSTNTSGSTININAPISGVAGGLVINTAGSSDVVSTGNIGAVSVNTFILQNGAWTQVVGQGALSSATALPGFSSPGDFEIQNGSTFLRAAGGDGASTVTSYQLTDIYGLQGINGFLGSDFVLNNNIDAAVTSSWNSSGFATLGSFSGTINGQNYTISNIKNEFISATTNAATVENLSVTGASISTNGSNGLNLGIVVGNNLGVINNVNSAGTVDIGTHSYNNNVGGLVGNNSGTISNSSSNVTVTDHSENPENVGGLVGKNQGNVSYSYSAGSVTNNSVAIFTDDPGIFGGLVGTSSGSISNSYNTATLIGLNPQGGGGDQQIFGGLVGTVTAGTVTNSYNTGNITNNVTLLINSPDLQAFGGLIGQVSSGATVSNVYSTGNVSNVITNSNTTGSGEKFGGLVGVNQGTITNAYAIGSVTNTDVGGTESVGGLVGSNSGTIQNAYSTGLITNNDTGTANEKLGGFVAVNNGTLTANFWDVQTSGLTTGIGSGTTTGASAGVSGGCFANGGTCSSTNLYNATNAGTGVIPVDLSAAATYTNAGWSINQTPGSTTTVPSGWFIFNDETRPFLLFAYSTTITNALQLQLAATTLGANYTLANNIDLTSTFKNAADIWGTNTLTNTGLGFVPIGNGSQAFSGNFAGNGYTINGLYENLGISSYGGLFGSANGGTVNNLALTNVTISGKDSIGALIGSASNVTLSNITTSGSVTGRAFVGGVVGYFNGGSATQIVSSETVLGEVVGGSEPTYIGGLLGNADTALSYSYFSGSVSRVGDAGSDGAVGGLIGAAGGGSISYSYNMGSVNNNQASSPNVVGTGGLIGSVSGADTSISDSYNIGSVTGGSYTGGLVGVAFFATANITNSYNSGLVSTNAACTGGCVSSGAIIGSWINGGFNPSNVFWDNQTSGQSYGTGNGDVSGETGLSTSGMMSYSNFQSVWNIADTSSATPNSATWFMVNGGTRPLLVNEEFSNNTPLAVSNAHQLQLVSADLSASYNLANNIDLTSAMTNAADIWGTNTNTSTGAGFAPIGSGSTPFLGVFNGNYHTISNLYINLPTGTNVGLFAANGQTHTGGSSGNPNGNNDAPATNALIENLGLVNASVTGNSNVGALAGNQFAFGNITNDYATGTVKGAGTGEIIGGLVGYNVNSITNSYTNVDVYAPNSGFVGGVVGLLNDGYDSNPNSYNALTGKPGAIIENVYQIGTVTGSGAAGITAQSGGFNSANYFVSVIQNTIQYGIVTNGCGTECVTYGANQNNYYDVTLNPSIYHDSGSTTPVSTSGLMQSSTYGFSSDILTSNSSTPNQYVWFMVNGSTRPMLVSEEFANNTPIAIQNGHQLQLIAADTSASYVLGSNVDLTSGLNNASDVWGTNFGSGTGNGLSPIDLHGTFNGESYAVNGFTSYKSGLFSTIESGATVENLGLTNARLSLTNPSSGSYGVLANTNNGTIQNVYATTTNASLTVTANSSASIYLGGLVGKNTGSISNSYISGSISNNISSPSSYSVNFGLLVGYDYGGLLSNDYALGTATNTDATNAGDQFGLLVGQAQTGSSSPSINNSYAMGTVTNNEKGGQATFGLLVGFNYSAAMNNDFAIGTIVNNDNLVGTVGVHGGETIGGLVGWAYGGSLKNSFSQGEIIDNGYYDNSAIGALAGHGYQISDDYTTVTLLNQSVSNTDSLSAFGGSATHSFYDTDTTGLTNNGSGGCFSVTCTNGGTSNLSAFSTYQAAGWSIADAANPNPSATWYIIDGQSYPFLQSFYSTGTPRAVSGTAYAPATSDQVQLNVASSPLSTGSSNGSITQGLASIGANGFYYFLESPGVISDGASVQSNLTVSNISSASVTAPSNDGSILNLNIGTPSTRFLGTVPSGTTVGSYVYLLYNGSILGSGLTNSGNTFRLYVDTSLLQTNSNYLLFLGGSSYSTNTNYYGNLLTSEGGTISNISGLSILSNTLSINSSLTISNTSLNTVLNGLNSSNVLFSSASNGSGYDLSLSSGVNFVSSAQTHYQLDGSINNAGGTSDIKFSGPVVLANTVSLSPGSSGTVEINNHLDDTNAGVDSLTINAPGGVSINSAIGSSTPINALIIDTNASEADSITANITTAGSQSYGNAVFINHNPTLTSTGGAGITFASTIDDNSSANTLSFANNSGTLNFNGSIGSLSALDYLVIGTGDTTSFGTNATQVQTIDDQTYGSALNLASVVTLTANNINFNDAINSTAGGLVLNANNNISTAAATNVNIHSFILQNGNWDQELGQGSLSSASALPAFNIAGDFELPGGNFLRVLGGDGNSTGTAYQIGDVYGLQGMVDYSGSDFVLSNNIDATVSKNWNSAAGFLPIGSYRDFYADFNGQGYTINNYYSTQNGLFSYVDGSGTIENVGLTNATVTLTNSNSTSYGILAGVNYGVITNTYSTGSISSTGSGGSFGGLVGLNENALSNSYSTASVSNTDTSGSEYFGGLVGQNGSFNNATITNSYATGNVTNVDSGNGQEAVGGLVGMDMSSGGINTSYSSGNVSSTGNSQGGGSSVRIGGFVGWIYFGNFSDDYTIGNVSNTDVSGQAYVGGFAGQGSGTINNSYSTGAVTNVDTGTPNEVVGGFAGLSGSFSADYFDTATSGIGSTQACGDTASCSGITAGTFTGGAGATLSSYNEYATNGGWNIADIANPNLSATWFIFDGQTRPLLMMEYSTTITNAHQLQLAGAVVGANYTLANNVNLTNGMTNASDVWGTNSTTSTGAGFVPLGNSTTAFTGSFNGAGFAINGLYIYQPTSSADIGLFGTVGSSPSISNVGLTNVNVTSGAGNTGGLIGNVTANNTMVSNVFVTGLVTQTENNNVGGIIGINNGTLINSYNAATVENLTGNGFTYVGGLVGTNNGSITQSFNLGLVEGYSTANVYAGGIVGSNNLTSSSITNSYNLGTVDRTNNFGYSGGIAGANSGIISDVFDAGAVHIAGGDGAIAGENYLDTSHIYNSFFDTAAAGTSIDVANFSSTSRGNTITNVTGGCFGSSSCTNGGSVDLTQSSTFTSSPYNWSTATWGFINGEAYPYLLALYPTTPRAISGTVNGAVSTDNVQLSDDAVALTTGSTNSVITQGLASLGANGFYYFLEGNGVIPDSSVVTAATTVSNLSSAATTAPINGQSITNLSFPSGFSVSGSVPVGTAINSLIELVLNGSIVSSANFTNTGSNTYTLTFSPTSSGQYLLYLSGANTYSNTFFSEPASAGSLTGINLTANTLSLFAGDTTPVSNTSLYNVIHSLVPARASDILFALSSNATGGYDLSLGNSTNTNVNFTTSANTNYQLDGSVSNTVGNSTVTLNGAVKLFNAASSQSVPTSHVISTGTGGVVIINNTVDDTPGLSDSLTMNASGGVQINTNDTIGSITPISAFTISTNGGENDSLSANVTTTGSQQYGNALTVSNNPTLQSSGAGGITFSSTIQDNSSGADTLTIANNSGALTFNGSIGAVALNSLIIGSGDATTFGSNVTSINTTGAQTYSGTVTLSSNVVMTDTGSSSGISLAAITGNTYGLTINTAGTSTISGIFSGSGSGNTLTLNANNSTGTLILTGANTYTGATTINAGILQVGSGSTTGSLGTGGVTDNASLVYDRSNNLTESNAISGSGSLTQAGSGSVTLTGNSTYSGGTNINSGIVSLTSNTGLGTGLTTVASGAELDISNNVTVNTPITLNGTGTTGNGALVVTGTDVLSGAITLNSTDSNSQIDVVTSADQVTLSGVVSGTNLNKSGAGIISLANSSNNYSGTTNIINGILTLNSATALPTSSALQIQVAAALSFSNLGVAVASLSGSGNVSLSAATLTTGGGNTSTTYGGNITGTGSFTKVGTGVLTLTGNNSFNGLTYVSSGTLNLASNTTLGVLSVAPGSTLEISNAALTATTISLGSSALMATGTSSLTGNINLTAASTIGTMLNMDALTITGNISGTSALSLQGPGAVTITGMVGASNSRLASFTTSSSGTTTLSGGSVMTSGSQTYSNPVTFNGNTTLDSGAGAIQIASTVNDSGNLTVISSSGAILTGGTITTAGNQMFNAPVTLGASTTLNSGGNVSLMNGVSGGNNLQINGMSGTNNVTLAGNLVAGNITVTGNSGSANTLTVQTNDSMENWTFNGAGGGNISGITEMTGNFNFSNMQNVVGGNNANTFTLNGGTVNSITGGNGANTVVAANVNNLFNLSGYNTGSVTGVSSFSNIQNVTGGMGNNTFNFANGSALSGILNGGNGSGTNTLNFSAVSTPVNFTLSSTHNGNVAGINGR